MNLKIILSVITFIIFYIVITSLLGFYFAIRPLHKLSSSITPADLGLQYENISFYTQDHVLIRGWFIPNKNPNAKTIILLHGYPADKGDILPSRAFLDDKYHLLLFDFRHLGQSEGSYTSIGGKEILDLLAAIQFLHQRNINEVGIWGLSMGGAVALMTAKHSSAIRAIVSESSYARLDNMLLEYYPTPFFQYPLAWLTQLWGKLFLHIDIKNVSPANAVKTLQIPILILHSKSDQVIPFDNALLIEKSLEKNPKAQFIFTDSLRHGELSSSNAHAIEIFFGKNL